MSDAPRGPIDRLPPILRRRPRGLLIDVTDPISLDAVRPWGEGETPFDPVARIVAGYTFCPVGCDPLVSFPNAFCEFPFTEPGDGEVDAFGLPTDLYPDQDEAVEFSSFAVYAGDEASTRFPEAMLAARVDNRLAVRWSAALAHELLTGEQTGNPSLRSEASEIVAGPTPVDEALYVIEDLLAQHQNAEGVIHASPGAFTLLVNEWGLEQDDAESDGDPNSRPFRTPTGHRIVGDAGHDGALGPVDPDTGDQVVATEDDGSWVYVTFGVQSWVGDVIRLGTDTATFEMQRNMRRMVKLRHALVGFDPCFVAAVQVQVPTYDVTTTTGD